MVLTVDVGVPDADDAPDELAAVCLELLRYPEQRRRLAHAGRELLGHRYCGQQIRADYAAELMERLAASCDAFDDSPTVNRFRLGQPYEGQFASHGVHGDSGG